MRSPQPSITLARMHITVYGPRRRTGHKSGPRTENAMSSAESRPKPDHKIHLSHAAGVVQPAGSESREGPNTTTASQAESLLAAEKREHGTNNYLRAPER